MKRLPLSQGEYAIVDDGDWERCGAHKWSLSVSKHGTNKWKYAVTSAWDGKKNHRTYLHHFVLGTSQRVDHINGDGLNNKRKNLRIASAAQNRWNAKRRRDNKTSRYMGVRKRKECRRWEARIQGESLGFYNSEAEAALAYNEEAEKRYGEFASLNEVVMRRFLQSKGRTSKPQVWEVQHTDDCVLVMWGQLDGAMQETVQTFKANNVGRSNEKSPYDVAKKEFEDLIKGKLKSGYHEVNLKTNKPLTKVSSGVFDFNDPHENSTNFKVFKPQSSMNAYMKKLAASRDALFCRKRDGYMHYLVVDKDGVADLYSANMALTHEKEPNIPLIERFPKIQKDLLKLELLPQTMLVGEICTSAHSFCDSEGHAVDDFQYVGAILKSLTPRAIAMQEEKGDLAFCIWDVVFADGEPWVKEVPASERFEVIRGMITDSGAKAITVPELVELKLDGFQVTSVDGADLELEYDDPDDPVNDIVNWAKAKKWEGFVVVDPNAVYGDKAWSFRGKNDRPKEICKLKPLLDVDVIVRWDPKKGIGEEGKGKHSGQVGSVAAYLWDHEKKEEVFVGKVGIGISDELTKKWAKPKFYPMVWECTILAWTNGGKMRSPAFIRLRDDKMPTDCGLDQMKVGGG